MATCAAELIATLLSEQSTQHSQLARLSRDLIRFVIGPYIAEPGTFALVSQSSRGLRGLLVSSYDLSNDSLPWMRKRVYQSPVTTLSGTTLVSVLCNNSAMRLATLDLCNSEPGWKQLEPQPKPRIDGVRKMTRAGAMPVTSRTGELTNIVAVQLFGSADSTGGFDWVRCDYDIVTGAFIRIWKLHTHPDRSDFVTIRALDDGSQYSWRFRSRLYGQWSCFFEGIELLLEAPFGNGAPTTIHIPACEFGPHPAPCASFDPKSPGDLIISFPNAFSAACVSRDMKRFIVFLATETSMMRPTSIVMVHVFDLGTLCRIGQPLVITDEPCQPEHPQIVEDRAGNFVVTTVNTFYIISLACNAPKLTSVRYRARFSPCYWPILPAHLPDDSVAAVGVYINGSSDNRGTRLVPYKIDIQLKVAGYHSTAPLPQSRNVSQRDTPLWLCLNILFGMLCRLLTLAWHRIRPYLRW
jgi:hypothetical protein